MLRVPASVTGDSSDVAVALEVATALWEKGDSDEAIRWLRRAAEAAGEAGDAPRAAGLARAAEELASSAAAHGGAPTDEASIPPQSVERAAGPREHGAPASMTSGVRLRVSVKTSVRDPGLLLLRALPDGQAPPAGTKEGFLIVADAGSGHAGSSNGNGAQS